MSKSFNAITGGFFGWSMRNAAPILFCSALILLALTAAFHYFSYVIPKLADHTDPVTRASLIVNNLMMGINNAVWPFLGAGLIWTLQNRAKGDAQ